MTGPLRLALAAAMALSACGAAPDDPQNLSQGSRDLLTGDNAAEPTPARPPAIDRATVDAMKARLLKQLPIVDVLYDPSLVVEWQVGVVSGAIETTTEGRALARKVCAQLGTIGLAGEGIDVRIVDMGRLEDAPGDFRAASVGHVDCRKGDSLGA